MCSPGDITTGQYKPALTPVFQFIGEMDCSDNRVSGVTGDLFSGYKSPGFQLAFLIIQSAQKL